MYIYSLITRSEVSIVSWVKPANPNKTLKQHVDQIPMLEKISISIE